LANPTSSSGGNHDRRSGRDRRIERDVGRSNANKFLPWNGRFSQWRLASNSPTTGKNVDLDANRRKSVPDRRSGNERRSGRDRRCGFDTRSEIVRFLQGERRSGLDRRSRVQGGYQTFKQARVFVRGLKLKSARKWDEYIKSGMKPDNIPAAPQEVYANDGWAGWNDWLGR
jgi:hypothetical protein